MRALFLIIGVAACAPLPPTTVTATEARGLAMLHALRAADPEPTCPEECPCDD